MDLWKLQRWSSENDVDVADLNTSKNLYREHVIRVTNGDLKRSLTHQHAGGYLQSRGFYWSHWKCLEMKPRNAQNQQSICDPGPENKTSNPVHKFLKWHFVVYFPLGDFFSNVFSNSRNTAQEFIEEIWGNACFESMAMGPCDVNDDNFYWLLDIENDILLTDF